MKRIAQGYYVGERPLFGEQDLIIEDTIFTDGESPLKESANIKEISAVVREKYLCERLHMV